MECEITTEGVEKIYNCMFKPDLTCDHYTKCIFLKNIKNNSKIMSKKGLKAQPSNIYNKREYKMEQLEKNIFNYDIYLKLTKEEQLKFLEQFEQFLYFELEDLRDYLKDKKNKGVC